MNVTTLAALLLSSNEISEMQASIELLGQSDYSAFYKKNQGIVQSILFIDTFDDFMDFSSENYLDIECFYAAFLCVKGYGIQIGGYEDDLTRALTEFFCAKGIEYPEIREIVRKEKIYTDYGDCDNFKKSMTAVNRVLDTYGLQLIILEDSVYCDCEYTMLILNKALAKNVLSSWSSDNFEIYL